MTKEDILTNLCLYMLDFGHLAPFDFYEVTDTLESLNIDWESGTQLKHKHVH